MTLGNLKQELENKIISEHKDKAVARLILSDVLDCDYSNLLFNLDKDIDSEATKKVWEILNKYLLDTPIQYVLGYTYFYGLKIGVNKDVLIPRFETEELVDWVLKDNIEDNLNVIDAGTGSGCIALSLKKNKPNWKVQAIDISNKALDVAKNNAKNLNLDIDFIESNFLDKISECDIIVSNPPYISLNDNSIDKEVLDNEPHKALFTTDELGLDSYRTIFEQIKSRPVKKAYFEFGYNQKNDLIKLLKEFGFNNYEFKDDISSKNRMLKIVF